MDEKEQDNVAAFDTLFTTNRIQLMKALLPCFDHSMQKYLAIYIKYQELQYTISYFKDHPYHICESSSLGEKEKLHRILPSLLPYCDDTQKKTLQQIQQMLSSLEAYQEMMEMMEMMKDLSASQSSDDATSQSSGMPVPDMDTLMSMLGPEGQTMMELLKGGLKFD